MIQYIIILQKKKRYCLYKSGNTRENFRINFRINEKTNERINGNWKRKEIYRDACTEKILKNRRLFKSTIFFEKMNSIAAIVFLSFHRVANLIFSPTRAKRSIYSTAKNFQPQVLRRSGSDGKVGASFSTFEEPAFPCNRFSLTTGDSFHRSSDI